ncbi:MAG: hypothetical protein KDJ27_08430 [Gammaproteobacteria bacterium]|nr:hypothetical protein [Gammaproteobacteria bacterium]
MPTMQPLVHAHVPPLSRRRFLAVMLGALAMARFAGSAAAADTGAVAPSHWIRPLVGDADAVRAFGERFLQSQPHERDLRQLVVSLDKALSAQLQQPLAEATDSERLVEAATRMIRNEYREARVVDIDGWILSLSEARLYGLATLLGADF